jgi:hypothetical protein
LFAVWTAACVELDVPVGALVVLVLEVVDEDPQAAAMAAAGTSPSRTARREGVNCRRRPGEGFVLLEVVAVSDRITSSLPCPIAGSRWAGSSSVLRIRDIKDCRYRRPTRS